MKKLSWPFSALTKALLFAALLLVAAACGDDSAETDAAAATEEDGAMDDDAMDDMDEDAMEDGDMEDMDHGDDHDGDHGDDHDDGHSHGGPIDVPEGMAVPTIALTAETDTKAGHNLFIELGDFTVAPESASTDPVDGEGHLHLYIDGERIMRFYNTELYLSGLEPGEHEVMVEVSANNHSAYAVDGEPITAMTTITVEEAADAGHDHGGDLFEAATAPEISLEVFEDPKSGHNLFIDITNFDFAPESVGGEAIDGEGHVHLIIDGEKVGRLYGPWTHLSLDPGTYEVMVELSGNDHVAYGNDGAAIMAMTTIEVAEGDGHSMDDMADDDAMEDMDEDASAMQDAADEDDDQDHGHSHSGTGATLDIAAADADVVINGTLADGDLDMDDRRFQVEEGQTVGVMFSSDEADEIHIHGYDILAEVGPGITTDLAFLADSPGTFEVEIEGSGRFLFEIQVR